MADIEYRTIPVVRMLYEYTSRKAFYNTLERAMTIPPDSSFHKYRPGVLAKFVDNVLLRRLPARHVHLAQVDDKGEVFRIFIAEGEEGQIKLLHRNQVDEFEAIVKEKVKTGDEWVMELKTPGLDKLALDIPKWANPHMLKMVERLRSVVGN